MSKSKQVLFQGHLSLNNYEKVASLLSEVLLGKQIEYHDGSLKDKSILYEIIDKLAEVELIERPESGTYGIRLLSRPQQPDLLPTFNLQIFVPSELTITRHFYQGIPCGYEVNAVHGEPTLLVLKKLGFYASVTQRLVTHS